MKLTNDTTLHLRKIEIRKDNKNYIVEDCETQEFYEMPRVCIDALEYIEEGKTLGEIEGKLIEEYPNEDIDLITFSQQLLELDLIQSINGERVDRKSSEKDKLGFEWIPPALGKVFFNKYTKYVYVILFFTNICIFIYNPSLFPHYKDFFVFDILSLNIVVLGLLSLVLVLFHELGHILAIRSFSLPTKLEIGHRLYLIVLETDLSLAWKLPPKQRNILYLAGVAFDSVILFIALILKMVFPIDSELFSGLIGLVIFDTVVRVIYQACIHMKTDFYFLFENITGSYNVMENGIQFIKNMFSKSEKENKELFKGEERIVKWYSFLYISGVAITIALLFIYYFPQLIYMGIHMFPGFLKPVKDPYFWDAVVFTLELVIIACFLLHAFYKTYHRKRVEN